MSGIDYYRGRTSLDPSDASDVSCVPGINERIAKLLPNGHIMAKNSDMVIVSLDCRGLGCRGEPLVTGFQESTAVQSSARARGRA